MLFSANFQNFKTVRCFIKFQNVRENISLEFIYFRTFLGWNLIEVQEIITYLYVWN